MSRSREADTRSGTYVGDTMASPAAANRLPAESAFNASVRKLYGSHGPKNAAVRTTSERGHAASTACSPAAFERPYTDNGDTGSLSTYGRLVRPSKTRSEENVSS